MTLSSHPLILTLKLDHHALETLDRLRRQYFPRQRNFLKAHLTLFHALPNAEEYNYGKRLRELCA